jgi:hypothetical protein
VALTLVDEIRKCVKPYPKPCVNISGGIDSTIVLHHLLEQTDEPVHTYTVGFTEQDNEFKEASRVAQHYGTRHMNILIENMLPTFKKLLREFKQPRFNLWPYWAAQAAHGEARLTCYIGEGGDEHFGGYHYKPQQSYLSHWSGFFTYVYPTYKTIYDFMGLRLTCPMHPKNLNWQVTYPYYDVNQEKAKLREAYRGILPDWVVDRRKQNGRFDYFVMWNREIKQYFPEANPQTEDEIRELLNVWVTREWSRVHQGARIVEAEAK